MLNELVNKIEVYEREIADGERMQKIDIYYNFVGILATANTRLAIGVGVKTGPRHMPTVGQIRQFSVILWGCPPAYH